MKVTFGDESSGLGVAALHRKSQRQQDDSSLSKPVSMVPSRAALALVLLAIALVASLASTAGCAVYGGKVEIGLPNRNMGVVRARALEASDPSNAVYGRFLSMSELRALVHDPEALAAVTAWVADAAPAPARTTTSGDGQWVTVETCTDGEAARLGARARTELPAGAVDRVHVHGGGRGKNNADMRLYRQRRAAREARARTAAAAAANGVPSSWPPGPPVTSLMTLAEVVAYYNITPPAAKPPAHPVTAAVFEVNAVEYNGEIVERYNPADLAAFQKLSGLPASPVTQFKGDNVTLGCDEYTCAEPNLDVELLRGVAPWADFTCVVAPPRTMLGRRLSRLPCVGAILLLF